MGYQGESTLILARMGQGAGGAWVLSDKSVVASVRGCVVAMRLPYKQAAGLKRLPVTGRKVEAAAAAEGGGRAMP